MSYEVMMGLGTNGENDAALPPVATYVMPPSNGMVVDEQFDVVEPAPRSISPWLVGGIVAGLGALLLFAVAIPFGIGAAAGAIAAPSGRKKRAAKWGALAGGLGGLTAYPIVYGLTGSTGVARSMSSLAPIALGAYMGIREKEEMEAERAAF